MEYPYSHEEYPPWSQPPHTSAGKGLLPIPTLDVQNEGRRLGHQEWKQSEELLTESAQSSRMHDWNRGCNRTQALLHNPRSMQRYDRDRNHERRGYHYHYVEHGDMNGHFDEGYDDSGEAYCNDVESYSTGYNAQATDYREDSNEYTRQPSQVPRNWRKDRERNDETYREHERDRSHHRNPDVELDTEYDGDRNQSREPSKSREMPNNTILVRGLPLDVTVTDIQGQITRFGLEPKRIRLKENKHPGAPRRYAFVEFNLLSEAIRWKELTQGVICIGDHWSPLHYCIPKNDSDTDRKNFNRDWNCGKCGINNFRWREFCCRCYLPRLDCIANEYDVATCPSNTLLLQNLNSQTTEEQVLAVLGQLTALPIKNLKMAKDVVTGISLGICSVRLHSTTEAEELHDLLLSMGAQFCIEGKQVRVSYSRSSWNATKQFRAARAQAATVALAAAQWTNQGEDSSYEQSCQLASSMPNHAVSTIQAQANLVQNEVVVSLGTVIVDGVTYQKYPEPDTSSYLYDSTSGFYYDATTSLYYDASSHYYYNATTQQYLYWDGDKKTYLPAVSAPSAVFASSTVSSSPISSTSPAVFTSPAVSSSPTGSSLTMATTSSAACTSFTVSAPPTVSAAPSAIAKSEDEINMRIGDKSKSKEKSKQNKVKVAKKLAKAMEKWAKTLDQKKEQAKLGVPVVTPEPVLSMDAFNRVSATVDAGYSVLERKTSVSEWEGLVTATLKTNLRNKNILPLTSKSTFVSEYGGGSGSESEPESTENGALLPGIPKKTEQLQLIDWTKMACLLCKRKFPSKEALIKHQQLSDLHKKNLEALAETKLASL